MKEITARRNLISNLKESIKEIDDKKLNIQLKGIN